MRINKRYLSILLPLIGACAKSSDEPVGHAASAINPEGSINSVAYEFALTSIGVVNANWLAGPGQFVEYAAVGASTQPFGSASNATLANSIEGCSLGAVPPGADFGHVYETLTTCASGTTTGSAPAGTPLSQALTQTVTLQHETDKANFAVVLTNTGGQTVSPSAVNGNGLGLLGAGLAIEGTAIGVASAGIGAAIQIIGALLSIPSVDSTPTGDQLCAGGLIGNPPDPGGVPAAPGGPYDTLYYSYTAAQLEAMTSATGTGSFTVSTPVSVNWATPLLGGVQNQCSSSHVINVTITRVAGYGPAADPLSGSLAVARTPTEIHAFVGNPARQGIADLAWSPAAGWSPSMVTPADYALGSFTPTATLSRQVVPAGTQLSLVSAAGVTAPPTTVLQGTLDSFWFDESGTLHWSELLPGASWQTGSLAGGAMPSSRLTATSRTPSVMDVFWVDTNGNLVDCNESANLTYLSLGFCYTTTVGTAVAPPGAGVAAVSRFYDTEDVLYIGNSGGLYDATYSATSTGGSWSVQPVGPSGLAPKGAYVTAVARDANTIDAFFIGYGGTVYWARYAASARDGLPVGWQTPLPIAGATGSAGGPISAVSRTQATIDLVYYSAPKLEFTEFNSTWTAPVQIGASTGSASPNTDISLVSQDSNNLALVYRDVLGGQHTANWNQTAGVWQAASQTLPTWKWQGWDSLSGGLVSDPTIASPTPTELVTAATGPDGTIWYAIHDTNVSPSWTGWRSLGNFQGHAFTDAPAMVAVGGRLEIFVRDPVSAHIVHQEGLCESASSCDSPRWNSNGWEDLFYSPSPTTFVAGQPTVLVSQPGNQVNVFATGTDGSAHMITGPALYGGFGVVTAGPLGTAVGVGLWTNLSGGIIDEPAAVSAGPNRLDVFVTGPNNQLYHRYSNDNGVTWNPPGNNWQGLGGSAALTPVAVSLAANTMDVFVATTGGGLEHVSWNGITWSTDLAPGLPGGLLNGGRPAAVVWRENVGTASIPLVDVFVQDAYGALDTATMGYFNGSPSWGGWTAMDGCLRTGSAPGVVSRDGASTDIVITAENGDSSVWHNSTAGKFTPSSSGPPQICL